MRLFVYALLISALAVSAFGQELNITDPAQLVGKKVIIGRMMPLCEPGTWNGTVAYAGKQATVVSVKPGKHFTFSQTQLNRMPEQTRDMMIDQQKAAVILFEMEDGKKLDSCAPLGPKSLADKLELAPGEAIAAPAQPVAEPASATVTAQPLVQPTTATATSQECPVVVTKVTSSDGGFGHAFVDNLTTSEYQRQTDQVLHGGQSKHYLDMKMKNASSKRILAVESVASYKNMMGEEGASMTLLTQNTKPLKPGEELKSFSMDREMLAANGKGEVTVHVQRVRFEDGSMWIDNGSHSCSLKSLIKN